MNQILLSSLRVTLLSTILATTTVHSQVFTSSQNIGGIINTYTPVTAIPNSNTMTVTSVGSILPCDKVLIIQMKGATISTNDDNTFGNITTIGNAGNYEEIYVASVSGNDITFQSNFINTYDVAGLVQIVTIPQYTAGASITSDLTCQPWNGSTGGVLVFEASDLYMGHQINVSGMGFRKGEENGGNLDHCQITDVSPPYDYATPTSDIKAAEKGEGIVVESSLLHGRGKLASGGGGGNVHNGGGGGGSNYGTGGLGGYAASICSPSAAAQIQGQGIGGVALSTYYPSNKIFLGGAGGAGQGNNNSSAPFAPNAQNDYNYGGNGGGIIIAEIDRLIIDWSTAWQEWNILANGDNAPQNSGGDTPVLYDGAGGGGAGGTIILNINTIDNQTGDAARNPIISAAGGIGGYNMNGSSDCYAPGGGGGGGAVLWLSATQPANLQSVSVNEGVAGQKNPAQSCPGSYGATNGTIGTVLFNHNIPLGSTSSIPPSVSISEDQNNICFGTNVIFTATPTNGGASPNYQWLLNGNNVGTNSSTYSSSSLNNDDTINVIITTSGGCGSTLSDTSEKITMVVTPSVTPTVSISEDVNNMCTGTDITFTSVVSGEGSSPIFQWQVNGANVGTNSATFSSSSLNNGDDVSLILTSNELCANPSMVTSAPIEIISSSTATPTISITEDQNGVCSGTLISFSSIATNEGTTPIYQWQVNGTNVGTNSSTYSSNTFNDGDVVTLDMTSNADCASPANVQSNSVTIDITPAVVPTVSISEDQNSVCSGTLISFSSTAANEGTTPIYQWLVNGSNVGTNSSTYSSNTFNDGDVVTLDMTSNADCASPANVQSNSVTIDFTPAVAPTVSISEDQNSVCSGTLISFSSTATNEGTTPIYQWQVNGTNVGTNSSTYSSNSFNDGDVVTLDMTSNADCASPVNVQSNSVTIDITPAVVPTASISEDQNSVCSGTLISFSSIVTNEGTTPIYQWLVNGSTVGTNSSTFNSSSFNNGDEVSLLLTSSEPCSAGAVNSNTIDIVIITNSSPDVNITPSSASICEGDNQLFTAAPTNAGSPDYQWYLNNNPVGSNNNTYSSSNFTDGDIIMVGIKSSLSCGTSDTANSTPVIINVNPNPMPVISGTSNICEGVATTLTANGGSSGAMYNWLLNGLPTGSNSSTHNTNMSGNYSVEIVNSGGCSTTSSDFTVSETLINLSAGPDLYIETGENIILQASTNATSVLWNNTETLNASNVVNPVASPLLTTTYTVTGSINGCTKKDSMTVWLSKPIAIPNAFTPNSDGENDQWIIDGLETYNNMKLQIFNRWGNIVYQTTGSYIPWDGTRNGDHMPIATYYYILNLKSDIEPITGSITLVR